jgi:hypothetical protein
MADDLAPGVLLTVEEAASACRVHEATIERALDGRRFPNAFRRSRDLAWLIPVGDLAAAGFPLSPYGSRTPVAAGPDDADAPADHYAELQEWRRRAEAAEARVEAQARRIAELERILANPPPWRTP